MVEIVLGLSDDGASRSVALGDVVVVQLDETPTSGYRWELEGDHAAILEREGDAYLPASTRALGGGGTREFRLRVVGPGTCRLRLERRRSWEPASGQQSFGITVVAGDRPTASGAGD